jgi:hypothetical protein
VDLHDTGATFIPLEAAANVNARISHLAKCQSAALEHAPAAASAAAGRQGAAQELLSREVPEGQSPEDGDGCGLNAAVASWSRVAPEHALRPAVLS